VKAGRERYLKLQCKCFSKITAPFLSFRAHVINELLNGRGLMMADAVSLV